MAKRNLTNMMPAVFADVPIPDTSRYEWQVISDIIQVNSAMPTVLEILNVDHFTSDLRKGIFNECVRLFNEGQPFDVASLVLAVGPEFVQYLYNPEIVDDMGYRYVEDHARILRHAAAKRMCYKVGVEILGLSQEQGTTDASIYSRAAEAIAKLEPTGAKREPKLTDILNDLAEEIQQRELDKEYGRPNRITSGLSALDDVMYGGFAPGNLVIVAARPSVGKTALSLHMMKAAATAGHKAAMFSIEMTADELAVRMVSSVSEEYDDENYGGLDRPRRPIITPYKIANGFDTPEDWDRFESAVGNIEKLPIIVNDYARDLRDIISRMTVLNKQGLCDIAYIDYLGLIKQAAADPKTPLYQQIADITGTLKATAKSLRIPIVLLCQLNREAAKQNKSPQLYNLRDSGSIEQDADVVLMLNQTPGPKLPDLEVWVRKNRQGEKDFGIQMRPNDNYTDFKELCIIQNK